MAKATIDPSNASWRDFFTTDGIFDVYRYQSFIFALVVIGALIAAGVTQLSTFVIPDTILGIVGLSQVVYIGGKLVTPTNMSDLNAAIAGLRTEENKFKDAATSAKQGPVTSLADAIISSGPRRVQRVQGKSEGCCGDLHSGDRHRSSGTPLSIRLWLRHKEHEVTKNILIFADGAGNEGGLLPDESRTNVYKLYRATRTGPESIIDPSKQLAFYVRGIGTPTPRHNASSTEQRRPSGRCSGWVLPRRSWTATSQSSASAAGRPHLLVRLQPRSLHGQVSFPCTRSVRHPDQGAGPRNL